MSESEIKFVAKGDARELSFSDMADFLFNTTNRDDFDVLLEMMMQYNKCDSADETLKMIYSGTKDLPNPTLIMKLVKAFDDRAVEVANETRTRMMDFLDAQK